MQLLKQYLEPFRVSYNVFLLIPSSFDIIALDNSDDNANLTASDLNSDVYFVRFCILFSFQFCWFYCPEN